MGVKPAEDVRAPGAASATAAAAAKSKAPAPLQPEITRIMPKIEGIFRTHLKLPNFRAHFRPDQGWHHSGEPIAAHHTGLAVDIPLTAHMPVEALMKDIIRQLGTAYRVSHEMKGAQSFFHVQFEARKT